MKSKIFQGIIYHRRLGIKKHQFKYKIFMMFINLSEINYLFKKYWFWSTEKLNIASFKRKNYLGKPELTLLDAVKETLATDKIEEVFILTNLAYFGYCFNPISIYFCFFQTQLTHCILEVTNTPWKEKHNYIVKPIRIAEDLYAAKFTKKLHVSPFMQMDYEYKMLLKYKKNKIILQLQNWRNKKCEFVASLNLRAKKINHKNMAKILFRHPLITYKVITAIYWQALKLWFKKIPFATHPKEIL